MTDNYGPYPDEMFEEAERREAENKRPFYRFFVVEYYGTGEGISYWLRATRNYESHDGVDRELQSFKEFVNEPFFFSGIEEPTEEYFRTQYAKLIPEHVSKMLDRKDQPGFIWDAHFHVNYS